MLQQNGTGTIILTGTNTYTGGTTISAARCRSATAAPTGSIAGNVANNGALVFNRSDSVTFGGIISGTGAVQKIGGGTTILTGANTYSGGTTISAGTLQIGNRRHVGIDRRQRHQQWRAGVQSLERHDLRRRRSRARDRCTRTAPGRRSSPAPTATPARTTISAGTLQIGNGGTTGSIAGNVINNAVLAFNRSDSLSYAGIISGSGSLTKLGTGTPS